MANRTGCQLQGNSSVTRPEVPMALQGQLSQRSLRLAHYSMRLAKSQSREMKRSRKQESTDRTRHPRLPRGSKRDHPDIAADVEAGKYPSMRAAAVAAGFAKRLFQVDADNGQQIVGPVRGGRGCRLAHSLVVFVNLGSVPAVVVSPATWANMHRWFLRQDGLRWFDGQRTSSGASWFTSPKRFYVCSIRAC